MDGWYEPSAEDEGRSLFHDIFRYGMVGDDPSFVLVPSVRVTINQADGWWGNPPNSASPEDAVVISKNYGDSRVPVDAMYWADISSDLVDVTVKESISAGKGATFTVTLMDKPFKTGGDLLYSDNVMFSVGRRVTIEMGWAAGNGVRFTRPIIYNGLITDVSTDFGTDGSPKFKMEGESVLDFVFERLVLPRNVFYNDLSDFLLKNTMLLHLYNLTYDTETKDGVPYGPYRAVNDIAALEAKFPPGFLFPRNRGILTLLRFLSRTNNIDIRADTRCNVLWVDGYHTGFPNILKLHGDGQVSLSDSQHRILQMSRQTVYWYKGGPYSNVEYVKTLATENAPSAHPMAGAIGENGVPIDLDGTTAGSGGPRGTEIISNYENRRRLAGAYQAHTQWREDFGLLSDVGALSPVLNTPRGCTEYVSATLFGRGVNQIVDQDSVFGNIADPEQRVWLENEAQLQMSSYYIEEEIFENNMESLIKEAKAYTSHMENALSVEIGALGDPVVRPGHVITLFGVGRRYSGEYEVEEVDSTISSNGFTQKLKLRTNTNVNAEFGLMGRDAMFDPASFDWF